MGGAHRRSLAVDRVNMIKLIGLLAATATPPSVLGFVPGGSSFTPIGEQTVQVCTMNIFAVYVASARAGAEMLG